MKSTRASATRKASTPASKGEVAPLFGKENFKWMIIGAVVMVIGFLLMAGGKSPDPNVFNADEIYSTRRITIAPIVILLGLGLLIVAIFKNDKKTGTAS